MQSYVVENTERITRSTLLLSLRQRDMTRLFSFQPGQYAAISFYHGLRPTPARCFSIVSSPTDQEVLQFSMRVRGHFTTGLTTLKAGDIVQVRGPFGGFVLDLAQDSATVMLAGGIGITPFMSMIRYCTAVQASNDMTLIYSCASQDDIPFLAELSGHLELNVNLKIIFVIGQGPIDKLADHVVATGRLTPEVLDGILGSRYEAQSFFICGPPPFMNGMIKSLRAKNVDPERIITESFAQGSHRQSSMFRDWPRSIYAMGAGGLALGSMAITVSDLIKTLPPSTYLSPTSVSSRATLTTSRQADLDALVNSLPLSSSSSPASAAVTAALLAAAPPPSPSTTVAAASSTTTTSPTGRVTYVTVPGTTRAATPLAPSGATAPVAIPAATPKPTPAATPPPKTCTTTQSGVTTCV